MACDQACEGRRARFRVCALALGAAGVASAQCMPFPARVDYVQNAIGLVSADFDGDGDADLAIGGATVRVLINDGHGVFTAQTVSAAPLSRIVAGDLDGDGDVDLVGTAAGAMGVLLNRGNGTFDPPVAYVSLTLDCFALADLDVDGDLDVVGARAGFVYTFANRGDGAFDPGVALQTEGANIWVRAADLNNDGDPEIVTANASPSQVFILWNRGGGVFAPAQRHNLGGSQSAWCVALADFDGDGDTDIALSCAADPSIKQPARVRVLRNDKDGAFVEGGGAEVTGIPQMMSVGDLDADGDIDIAVTSVTGQVTHVLMNRGDASFDVAGSLTARPYPTQVVLADFNGDGRLDLAAAGSQLFPPIGYISVFAGVGCCRTDVTHDGVVNSSDVSEFINLYFEDQAAGTLAADFNDDGVSNSTDVSDFVGVWFEETAMGCP